MREFFKSFFSFGAATAIERFLSFILVPICTRIFTTVEYGVIDLCQVFVGVLSIFTLFQLETALQRYYFEWNELEKKKLLSTLFMFISLISALVVIVFLILAPFVSAKLFDGKDYSSLIRISLVQLPFLNISMLGLLILRYEKRNILFLLQISLKSVLLLFFVLLFVVFFKKGIEWIFYSQLIVLILSSLILLVNIKDLLVPIFSRSILKICLKYSLPQFPARIGSALLTYSNRFFMIGFLSTSAIGIYSVSLKFASMIQLIGSAFVLAWSPFMYAQFTKNNHKETFVRVLPLVSSLLFLCVALLSLFSEEIVRFTSGDKFYDAHYYLGGLSLYFALYIVKEVVDIGPKYTEKTKYLSYNFLCTLIVNILSMYFFIDLWGLKGVVFSMVLTYLFLLVISWFVSNRLYYIPFKKLQFLVLLLPTFLLSFWMMYHSIGICLRIMLACLYLLYYLIIALQIKK